MKKKLMTVFAVLVLAVSMIACGDTDSAQTTDKKETPGTDRSMTRSRILSSLNCCVPVPGIMIKKQAPMADAGICAWTNHSP